MRIKLYLFWGFFLILWMRDVYGGKILLIFLSVVSVNGIIYFERKCRVVLVFGNCFMRICKLGFKLMFIFLLIVLLNYCNFFVELMVIFRIEGLERLIL